MPNLLLEIRCEDLPASVLPQILEQLSEISHAYFAQNRIAFENIEVFGTLRRIVLIMTNVSHRQSEDIREVRGPIVSEAFFANGIPTVATEGFAKDVGVEISDLRIKEYDGQEYMVALFKEECQNTVEILPKLLPQIIMEIKTHNDIRWGLGDFRFVRPLRSVVAMYGQDIVNFTIGDISSGNISRGNRFLAPYKAIVQSADSYKEVMEENMIIIEQNKRKDIINWQINMYARRVGATIADDNGTLLNEIVNRVEYPTALLGAFNPEFLKLPTSLLYHIISLEQHHFPLIKDGKMLSQFIAVRDGDLAYISVVRDGYERVLNAKLGDASFFYEHDKKRDLNQLLDSLNWLKFKDMGGNMRDKTERHQKVSLKLAQLLHKDEKTIEFVKRAALLSFVDLSTGMVLEHPSLRGIIGKEYLQNLGESEEVCTAIGEQYLPNYENDNMPSTDAGCILAISGKVDDLCLNMLSKQESYAEHYALNTLIHSFHRFVKEGKVTVDILIELMSYTLSMLSVDEKSKCDILKEITSRFKRKDV